MGAHMLQGDPFYAPVRTALAAALSRAAGRDAPPAWMDCVARGCEVRTAAPLAWQLEAGALAKRLLAEGPEELHGAPLIAHVAHENGHLLFSLTPAFHTAAIRIACESLPPAEGEWDAEGETAYAINRMRMLARHGPAPCPPDPVVCLALWRALGIPERLGERKALRLRLEEARSALLAMTHHLPPRERPALERGLGGVGEAAARLLALGCKHL